MFKKIVWLWFSSTWKNAKDVEKYITSLVEWWATEFFTWYTPSYWSDKFGFEVSPNWRFSEHEQITDFETLKLCVENSHKHWLEIFANLNAWYYTDITFPYIEKMVWEFIEVWIDWIICWNISILEYLKSINFPGKINISTILALYNSESIRFFLENYNVNKIILSREVTLKEIEKLVTSFPNTKFEVFWEWDFCRYNNWLCFAEHKYWARDICTVVVWDLIFKKRFRADFKKIILDNTKNNLEKIEFFNDEFSDIFDQISQILDEIDLWIQDLNILNKNLFEIYKKSLTRVDLYFDSLSWPNSIKNKKILTFFKWLKYLLANPLVFTDFPPDRGDCGGTTENYFKDFENLRIELEKSIKTWMEYFANKLKELSWEPKLKALERNLFYSKWDSLNLYSYLFFSKFKNIETVKFPTRWRNHNEKLKIIEEVVESWKIEEKYIDRWINIERTHYDLTYLFKDKLWFRKIIWNF